jgi:hypothetical protein
MEGDSETLTKSRYSTILYKAMSNSHQLNCVFIHGEFMIHIFSFNFIPVEPKGAHIRDADPYFDHSLIIS